MEEVYRAPSTSLNSELDDKLTEREGSRIMLRFLTWASEWMLMSLTEMVNTGEKGQMRQGEE